MLLDPKNLPDDVAALKALLIAEHAARLNAETIAVDAQAEIENLKLTIAKMRRDQFGTKSKRGSKLLDQLELQLAELEASVAHHKAAAELAIPAGDDTPERQYPARRPLPGHLPRERVMHTRPDDCPGCGGALPQSIR